MRIHVLSDLHLELPRCSFTAFDVDADVVVLAGDIHQHERGIEWARQRYAGTPVVYVAGNHEYYGAHWHELVARLREAARGSNVHFLEDDAIEIDGVRFLGTTLWTDFALHGAHAKARSMHAAEQVMYDFKRIRCDAAAGIHAGNESAGSPDVPMYLRAPDTVVRHDQSRKALLDALAQPFDGTTVVVTHHLPAWQSVALRYRDDPVSAGFASDLEAIVLEYAPALWIHGHTHDSFDYTIGATRVVCNPRGYEARDGTIENGAFRPDLVVRIPS